APSTIAYDVVGDRPVRSIESDGPHGGFINVRQTTTIMDVDIIDMQILHGAIVAVYSVDTSAPLLISQTVAIRGVLKGSVRASIDRDPGKSAHADAAAAARTVLPDRKVRS